MATLLWFRRDLRLADNPALAAAIDRGQPIVPIFVHAPGEEDFGGPGGASRWWLHHSLADLARRLEAMGSRLVVKRGPALEALREAARECSASAVYWNRLYEPAAIARDKRAKEALRGDGLEVRSFNAALLFEPATIQTQSGGPYKVFTPFWRMCLSQPEPPEPVPAPRSLPANPAAWPSGVPVDDLGLLPRIRWDERFPERWTPGEEHALRRLRDFAADAAEDYPVRRDLPAEHGTSRLSPHLHWGEVGPRQAWHAARRAAESRESKKLARGVDKFLAEVGWREFAHHLLYHFPATKDAPLRPEFEAFPWRDASAGRAAEDLRAWQRGRTGYPIVDAGMRELWATGWMHNRVRMIVGSLLVKHLLIDWRLGQAWFRDTLVDHDIAANVLGWQWCGGCGADAAPYFRIFNPMTQAAKFDPEGAYIREWVPELAAMPAKHIAAPWEAPASVLRDAGVELGKDYPLPIVDHKEGRARALQAYEAIKKGKG